MMFGMKAVTKAKSLAEEAERLAAEADEKLQQAFKDNCKALARFLGHSAENDNRGERNA